MVQPVMFNFVKSNPFTLGVEHNNIIVLMMMMMMMMMIAIISIVITSKDEKMKTNRPT